MVGDHGLHLCESNTLQTDASDDLLVGEGQEQFPENLGFIFSSKFVEDDDCAEEDGDSGGDYEGKQDLPFLSELSNIGERTGYC